METYRKKEGVMSKDGGLGVYKCCHIGCKETSWLGNGSDWKMCEIIFGVHPQIIEKLYGSPIVIEKKLNFCRNHASFYKDFIYSSLAKVGYFNGRVCREAFYATGLGCFVTIHDCLVHSPIQVFQISYGNFKRIFLSLPPTIASIVPNQALAQCVDELRKAKTSVNLSVSR
jgi:hypothetical protein